MLVRLLLVGAAVGAPVLAALLSIRPTRATRPAATACAVLAILSALAFAGGVWESWQRTGIDDQGQERGDDSGVAIAVGGILLLLTAWNVGGWGLARSRAVDRRPATPTPPGNGGSVHQPDQR